MNAVTTFETALEGQSIVHRTTTDAFADALAAAIDPPAVGVPLPFEAVSLTARDITIDPDLDDLEAATTGVTPAGLGIAEYGTVTLPSTAAGGELVSLYVDRHVAVLAGSDIVPDVETAYSRIDAEGPDTQILATGPSATADMGDLIRGVHGPHETHVIVLEDQ
ncbi:MAG: LUD domain-containing protein [Salinirussus sp.]